MTASLDGAFAKVAWANRHLQELQAEIGRSAIYTDSVRFAQQFHSDTATIEVTVEGVPQLPIHWSLLAADYVQNLRCALNYLAWELSRWNLEQQGITRDPDPKTQFPINTVARQFDAWRLPDVHPDHVARIRRLQPNEADHLSQIDEGELDYLDVPTLAKRHVLGILVALTNDDKHRILPGVLTVARQATIGGYEPINCEVIHINHFVAWALENGTKWTEVTVRPTGGGEPKVKVDDQVITEVHFGEWGVDRVLPRLGQGVEHMIRSFADVF